MDSIHIRSISDLSLKLENLDPEQVKTIHKRRQQLNSRPVPDGNTVGLGEGTGGPSLTQPYAFLPRWKSFRGNLLWYQQQLEGALEIHTLSRELDGVTEQIGEKVSSKRLWQLGGGGGEAFTQSFPCILHPLLFSLGSGGRCF